MAEHIQTNTWLPITMAPKDGTKMDLCFYVPVLLDPRVRVADCMWYDGRWVEPVPDNEAEYDPDAFLIMEEMVFYTPSETGAVKATHFMLVELPGAEEMIDG